MILLCAAAVGICASVLYRGDSIEASAGRAGDIAQSVAAMIDGDEFVNILKTGEKTDHWYAVKASVDKIKRDVGVTYLYVLDSVDDGSGYMRYFAEGFDAGSGDDELDLGDLEETYTYPDEMFETIRTGAVTTSDVYDSLDYGRLVSGFAPIRDSTGSVVGVVGIDWEVDHVLAASRMFVLQIALIALACCVVFAAVSVYVLTRIVGRPITALTEISHRIAQGDVNCEIEIHSGDEIGRLADAFTRMVASTKKQAEIMESLAEGDLTVDVELRSEADLMNRSISHMVRKLSTLLTEVLQSTNQVAGASAQIAQAAQNLASGSSEQAATLSDFSGHVTLLFDQSQTNAEQFSQTSQDIQQVGALMRQSMESMDRVTGAMSAINQSSDSISRVIKVIEDIAFQTNILALNASVEAARAGQHGKGFAVVADEVRNLASKSADAAKETTAMIKHSIARVTEGDEIVRETHGSIQSVGEIAGRSAGAMENIAGSSRQQSDAISDINEGITQLSIVVQQNAATAEEAAATSQQMAAQAALLQEVVSRFRVRDYIATQQPVQDCRPPSTQAQTHGEYNKYGA